VADKLRAVSCLSLIIPRKPVDPEICKSGNEMGFQVHMAANKNMTAFLDMAPFSLVEVQEMKVLNNNLFIGRYFCKKYNKSLSSFKS
jgi:hypothetical protein